MFGLTDNVWMSAEYHPWVFLCSHMTKLTIIRKNHSDLLKHHLDPLGRSIFGTLCTRALFPVMTKFVIDNSFDDPTA